MNLELYERKTGPLCVVGRVFIEQPTTKIVTQLLSCGLRWYWLSSRGPGTRSVLVWHDQENGNVIGELMFYLKEQDVFQIECGSPRYRTVEGITVGSRPGNVKKDYQHLSAFQLWNSGSDEVGGVT